MGKILAVCTSPEKGTPKTNVGKAELIANYGLAGDAHAGVSANQARQVSLISFQKIEGFRAAAVSADKKVKIEHVYNTIMHILSARRSENRCYKDE